MTETQFNLGVIWLSPWVVQRAGSQEMAAYQWFQSWRPEMHEWLEEMADGRWRLDVQPDSGKPFKNHNAHLDFAQVRLCLPAPTDVQFKLRWSDELAAFLCA